MSGATIEEFLGYWESEGAHYVRRGDYDWMAAQIPPGRVLEIGCGPGFGTQALLRRGCEVLALESLPACIEASAARCGATGVLFEVGDVLDLNPAQLARMEAFSPVAVVCWLMGAPATVTGAAASDGVRAVVAYRERVHRAVAELAARLPSVHLLHVVDRTLIAWQAKDLGRDTLVNYHLGKTLSGLPFAATRSQALYRKMDDNTVNAAQGRKMTPALRGAMSGAVPVLASLLATRRN